MNAYRMLVGKPEGKRPLRRPRRRWVDNIKMDGTSGSGEGPVEGPFEYGNESLGSLQFWEILEYLHNWRLLKKDSAP
jgi:hypothetical protein